MVQQMSESSRDLDVRIRVHCVEADGRDGEVATVQVENVQITDLDTYGHFL